MISNRAKISSIQLVVNWSIRVTQYIPAYLGHTHIVQVRKMIASESSNTVTLSRHTLVTHGRPKRKMIALEAIVKKARLGLRTSGYASVMQVTITSNGESRDENQQAN